jgi:hypothetical protein
MLKYANLSKGQKRCIDALVELKPELASAETITTKELRSMMWDLYHKREDGGVTTGYPNWLVQFNGISRGVIAFPGPQSTGTSVAKQNAAAKQKLEKIIEQAEKVEIDEDEFTAELRANGIQV